jgi:hypothetical protein
MDGPGTAMDSGASGGKTQTTVGYVLRIEFGLSYRVVRTNVAECLYEQILQVRRRDCQKGTCDSGECLDSVYMRRKLYVRPRMAQSFIKRAHIVPLDYLVNLMAEPVSDAV